MKGYSLPDNKFATFKKASEDRPSIRGRKIQAGDKYWEFYLIIGIDKDGQKQGDLIGKIHELDVNRCETCNKPILEEDRRFCSTECAQTQFDSEVMDIEERTGRRVRF
jgi:hypothetical protein